MRCWLRAFGACIQKFCHSAQEKGEAIMRAYTPTSSDEDLGYFDLVVKVYFANEHPSFPLVRSWLCVDCFIS